MSGRNVIVIGGGLIGGAVKSPASGRGSIRSPIASRDETMIALVAHQTPTHDPNLIKRRARHLKRLLLRNGRSQHDADDLIQEAFLRLHVHCQSDLPRQEEAFLKRTVMNLSVDLHRRSHRNLYVDERPEDLSLIDIRPTPDENLALRERVLRVEIVLRSLTSKTCDVFLMHRLEGYSCAQIAAHFQITVSAVEKHIARAALALMDAI